MLEKIQEFLSGSMELGSMQLPNWALVLAGVVVLVLLIVIIAACSKGRINGKSIDKASQIIQDIQTDKKLQIKEFTPPVPTYDEFAELPDPESTSKPIDDVIAELLGKNKVEETPIVEEPVSEDLAKEEPIENKTPENKENEAESSPIEETDTLDEVKEEPVEEPIEEVQEDPSEELAAVSEPVAEEIAVATSAVLAEDTIDSEKTEEPIVEENPEEITFDTDISEEVAQEEEILTDNIVEEVAQEEIVEEAPIEEIVEEKPEEVVEEFPVIEEPIEEPVQEEAPVAEPEPTPVIIPVVVPVATEEIKEEPVTKEEIEPEKEEPAINVTLTPVVPVITPAKTKRAPLPKKATLVKAPVSRPKGSKPKKASAVKQTVASTEPKKNVAENAISNFAPITKIDGDKKVQIIKLFGDKIEPSRGKYVVVKDEENLIKPFSFALKANNGQLLFTSQGYKIHPRGRQIETFRKAIENGTFNFVKTKSGEFTFKLIAADGKTFGKGMDYPNIEGAEKACESVKKFAEKANYIEDDIE